MQCARCRAENREGRRFCGECGLSLAATCPFCGFANEGNEKFCGGCGRALTAAPEEPKLLSPQAYMPQYLAEKILGSRSALEGERKQATMLFADLKGSMELLADRDPEEARKLLGLALSLASLGRFVEARSHALQALRIAERTDHPFTLAETLTGVGGLSLAQGDYDAAIESLERARVVVDAWKLQPWAVLGRLGYAFALSGRLKQGREFLEEVARSATTMSSMGVGRAMQLAWLGEALSLEGRVDDAERRAHEALSLAQRQQERGHEGWSLRLLGEIASRRDPCDAETAETYYREALT